MHASGFKAFLSSFLSSLEHVVFYLNEQKVESFANTAVLTDEFGLTHRSVFFFFLISDASGPYGFPWCGEDTVSSQEHTCSNPEICIRYWKRWWTAVRP